MMPEKKFRQMKEKVLYFPNVYIHLEEMRIRLQTCRLEFFRIYSDIHDGRRTEKHKIWMHYTPSGMLPH